MPHGKGSLLGRRHGGVAPRLWGRVVMVIVDLWLVVCLARMLLGTREDFVRDAVGLFAIIVLLVLAVCVPIVRAARRRVHDIHEDALVLRMADDTGEVVIPWSTVDPGRILLSWPSRSLPAFTFTALRRWAIQGPVVLVNGRGIESDGADAVVEHYRQAAGLDGSPFDWWRLEVTDPVELLLLIESAMVADGQPASGLAAAVLARRYPAGAATMLALEEFERGATDEAIGLRQH